MALELEQIQPWDGQSGTGAEVRGALNRNFEKLKDLSILAGMPIKDLFTSVDLLPRPGISGNNYLVGENLYVWSESVLDYVDIGSVKGQDGLDGIDGKDSKQVTTVAYDGTRPVLRLLTDGSGVSYPVPTFSKSDGSTTTIITEAATYTNAEALSSKVDKGGSDKTLKQVEDEIVQLAGVVDYSGALDIQRELFPKSIPFSDFTIKDTIFRLVDINNWEVHPGINSIVVNIPQYAKYLVYRTFESQLFGMGLFLNDDGAGFSQGIYGDNSVKVLDLKNDYPHIKSIAYSWYADNNPALVFYFLTEIKQEDLLTTIQESKQTSSELTELRTNTGLTKVIGREVFNLKNTAVTLLDGKYTAYNDVTSTGIIGLGNNWSLEYTEFQSALYGLGLFNANLGLVATIQGQKDMNIRVITHNVYPGAAFFAYCFPDGLPDPVLKLTNYANIPDEFDKVNKKIIDGVDTRLFNPKLESFDTYNSKNPDNPVLKEFVLNAVEENRPFVRIPTCYITADGSLLVAAEMRKHYQADDFDEMDIRLARKDSTTGQWTEQDVFKHDPVRGRFMNPSFVEDVQGLHGVAGRIYLFAMSCSLLNQYDVYATTEQMDCVYKYSDDQGKTWSGITSIKGAWDTSLYKSMFPSPANGIQIANGTLVIPAMCTTSNNNYKSGVIYKKPGENWKFSDPTPVTGENESTAYERDNNEVILDCRYDAGLFKRKVYKFDLSTGDFIPDWTNETFIGYMGCQSSITSGAFGGEVLYLKTFPDNVVKGATPVNSRRNTTVWISKDTHRWIRAYNAHPPLGMGYSVLHKRQDKMIICYERYDCKKIEVQTLDNIFNLIEEAAWLYNLSDQERMAMRS